MDSSSISTPSVGIRLLKGFLILVLGLGGLMLVGKLFPLPKGSGLQYVAHPFWALVGIGMAAIGYLISAFVRPSSESISFWIALALTLGFTTLIFCSV